MEVSIMELKGSKTEKNLLAAFAGESQARNKYTYFASVAKKEGYEQISAIFTDTANNEKEHAKMWFKALGELKDTASNLAAAADGAALPRHRVPRGGVSGRRDVLCKGIRYGARLHPPAGRQRRGGGEQAGQGDA